MLLVVVVLAAALVVGIATGGSLDHLGRMRLRRRVLVPAAFGLQVLGLLAGGPLYAAGLLASAVCVTVFLAVNRGVRGTGLVALGLLANGVVVAANGAMPVSLHATDRAGVGVQDLLTGADPRHEVAGPRTRLPWLGDVVPVRWPLRPEVVSPGDVLVAAGLAQLVVLGLRGRQPEDATLGA